MRGFLGLVLVALALALLTAVSVQRTQEPVALEVEAQPSSAAWVAAPGPPARTLYLQTVLELPSPPSRAWIRVETTGGVTVYAGGDPITKDLLWRPTRPDQNGLSSRGQRLRRSPPAIDLNFPREYQWGEGGVPAVGILSDLTPYLDAGVNRLSLHVESRSPRAAARVSGEVILDDGSTFAIHSGPDWTAGATPPGGTVSSWLAGSPLDTSSARVERASADASPALTLVPEDAFSSPFSGRWMQVPAEEHVWFRSEFERWQPVGHPWLRILADHPYDLFVNGRRLTGLDPRRPAHSAGEWLLATRAADDIVSRADRLDLDEIRSPFDLVRYGEEQSQRSQPPLQLPLDHGDTPPFQLTRPDRDDPSQRLPTQADTEPTAAQRDPLRAIPRDDVSVPLSLIAHDLRWALRPGRNVVEIRVAGTTRGEARSRTLGIAVDGNTGTGPSSSLPASGWSATGSSGEVLPVSVTDVPPPGNELPPLRWDPRRGSPSAPLVLLERAAPWAALYLLSLLFVALLERRRRGGGAVVADVLAAALPSLAVAVAIPLLAVTFAESRQGWTFARPGPWTVVISVCLLAPLATAVLARRKRTLDAPAGRLWSREPHRIWLLLVGLLALVLRVYAIDSQPLDDDEYASTQAILQIARTGLPSLVPEDVMYTRGPLYHYLVAGFVAVFGEEVWVLRLPSAIFGLLTALLIQRMGARILGSGWLGLAAMLLYAVHPFCVFTGHVVRFYQQQQFFSLLAVHLFILGYVRSGPPRLRRFAVAAWVAAVLSQEISALFGVQLGLGFLLLRRGRPWRADLPVFAYGLVGVALIALDYACFKVLCQTRTEGISPNVEARVGFNLIHPFNMAALFLGYSRLHLLGSLLLVPSIVRGLTRGSRGVLGLHFVLLSGVVLSNLFITHVSLRYQYWLIPLWCLLVVHGGVVLSAALVRVTASRGPVTARSVALCRAIGLGVLVSSFAPWRLPSSYGATLLGDSTGAMEFIADHLREEDRVLVTEPHSHAALLVTGQVDGYLSFPMLPDYHVLQDGVLIDRNGGAPVISSLSGLKRAFEEPGRIWVAVNREKLRNRSRNLRWEYPGSRVELFLRRNCVVAHETYLWSVFLWDPGGGRWKTFGGSDY